MNLKNEFDPIRTWAEGKGIYESGDIKTQTLKLIEEAGELCKAVLNEDLEEIEDAIGDCVVVLTSIAELTNKHFGLQEEYWEDVAGDGGSRMYFPATKISIESCTETAYNVITKRKGKMENGTFKKD